MAFSFGSNTGSNSFSFGGSSGGGLFGSSNNNNSSGFGSSSSTGFGFGSNNNSTTSSFGGFGSSNNTNAFGSTSSFGNNNTNNGLTSGNTGSAFGSTSSFGSTNKIGTKHATWSQTHHQEKHKKTTKMMYYQSIVFMDGFIDKSHDELRMEDLYGAACSKPNPNVSKAKKTNAANNTSAFGFGSGNAFGSSTGFGSSGFSSGLSTNNTSSSLSFGSNNNNRSTNNTFGSSFGSSLGGTSSTNMFGSTNNNNSSSGFGSGSNSLFGNNNSTTTSSGFGSNSLFGSNNNNSTSGSSGFSFGSSNNNNNNSSSTNLWGNNNNSGSSLFGSSNNNNNSGTSLFGSSNNSGTSSFGFGSSLGNNNNKSSSLFGNNSSNSFGSGSGFSFGSNLNSNNNNNNINNSGNNNNNAGFSLQGIVASVDMNPYQINMELGKQLVKRSASPKKKRTVPLTANFRARPIVRFTPQRYLPKPVCRKDLSTSMVLHSSLANGAKPPLSAGARNAEQSYSASCKTWELPSETLGASKTMNWDWRMAHKRFMKQIRPIAIPEPPKLVPNNEEEPEEKAGEVVEKVLDLVEEDTKTPPSPSPNPEVGKDKEPWTDEKEDFRPTLNTKPGDPSLETIPAWSEIQEMSSAQLANLKDFEVHSDYGKIKWNEPVDIRGLNIGEIVLFSKRAIKIYGNDKMNRPPWGTGLNVQCQVMLYDCWPKVRSDGRPSTRKIESYRERLQKFCTKHKLVFQNYENGFWEFEIIGNEGNDAKEEIDEW